MCGKINNLPQPPDMKNKKIQVFIKQPCYYTILYKLYMVHAEPVFSSTNFKLPYLTESSSHLIQFNINNCFNIVNFSS